MEKAEIANRIPLEHLYNHIYNGKNSGLLLSKNIYRI